MKTRKLAAECYCYLTAQKNAFDSINQTFNETLKIARGVGDGDPENNSLEGF